MSQKKPMHPALFAVHLAAVAMFCLAALTGCGNGDDGEPAITGNVLVSWAPADCSAEGQLNVVARVYDTTYDHIASGGPWQCSAGEGTLDVTAGSNRTVVLFALDNSGRFKYRGEKRGLEVPQDEETLTFIIDLTDFAPLLLLIEDGIAVAGEFTLSWEPVVLADEYLVSLSDNPDFLNPVIEETITGQRYTPTNLTTGVIYYWKVRSLDNFGNLSTDSEVRQFLFREPEVAILQPLDGALFSAADDIEFSGRASDMHGAPLTGMSLVWESSLDGILGAGEAFNLYDLGEPPLTAGTHIITLTAEDDEGYAGSDSIALTIIAPD